MLDKFTASALREKTSIKSIIMMRYGLDLAKNSRIFIGCLGFFLLF
jgi:hypothetical protein